MKKLLLFVAAVIFCSGCSSMVVNRYEAGSKYLWAAEQQIGGKQRFQDIRFLTYCIDGEAYGHVDVAVWEDSKMFYVREIDLAWIGLGVRFLYVTPDPYMPALEGTKQMLTLQEYEAFIRSGCGAGKECRDIKPPAE